LSLDLG